MSHRHRSAAPRAAPQRSRLAARGRAWLVAAAFTLAVAAHAAPAFAQQVANGVLLIASNELADPNFARSVVLVLRHDDNGTIGVVVNRPTTLEPAKVFPELAPGIGTYPGRLYRGGPISAARLLFLVRGLAAATVQGPEIIDKVFLSGDPESLPDILRLADGVNELRMYAGHAEWIAGQLESEIAAGGWKVIPATAEHIFHADPPALWEDLSRRSDEVVASAR